MENRKRSKVLLVLCILIGLLLVGFGSYFVIDKYFSKDDTVDKNDNQNGDNGIVLYNADDVVKEINKNTFFTIDNLVSKGYLNKYEGYCSSGFHNNEEICYYSHTQVSSNSVKRYYINSNGRLMITASDDVNNANWTLVTDITESVKKIIVSSSAGDSTFVLTETGDVYKGQNGNREYVKLDLPDKVKEIYYDDFNFYLRDNFYYALLENGKIYGLEILESIEQLYEYPFGILTEQCGNYCPPNFLLNFNREIFYVSYDAGSNKQFKQITYNDEKIYANVVFMDWSRNIDLNSVTDSNVCIIDKNNNMYVVDGKTSNIKLYNEKKVSKVIGYSLESSEDSYLKVVFEDDSSIYFSYSSYYFYSVSEG